MNRFVLALLLAAGGPAAASDPGLETAWRECVAETRTAPKMMECTGAFSGTLRQPYPEPDTEHGRLLRAILDIRRRLAEQAEAESNRQAEARQNARAAAELRSREREEQNAAAERARREQELEEQERQRVAEQAAAEHAAVVEQRKRDPKWAIPILSGVVCAAKTQRAAALKEIGTEQRYSRLGNVQNNVKLYGLQKRVRTADETIDGVTRALREKHWKLLACTEPSVVTVAACIEAHDGGHDCDEEQRPYAEVMGFQ